MTRRNRDFLKGRFKNGARPSQGDFEDLIDSFLILNEEDGLGVNEPEINTETAIVWNGLTLGPSSRELPGTLRFQNDQITYFTTDRTWEQLGGGEGGAFQVSSNLNSAVFSQGNVGIGSSFAESGVLPGSDYLLEVSNRENFGQSARVRFGSLVCGNGPTFSGRSDAFWAHQDHFSGTNFAFYQDTDGEVRINTPLGGEVTLSQNGDRTMLSARGSADLTGNSTVTVAGDLEVNGNLTLRGDAFELNQGTWVNSDIRVKENIRDFEAGLEQLLQVRPVRFCFNGKANTPKGQEGVSVLAQEIETILPEMVRRSEPVKDFEKDDDPLMLYNSSALTYVLVNAVKELTTKVQQLEADLAEVRREQASQ
jgi:hypothetical protein